MVFFTNLILPILSVMVLLPMLIALIVWVGMLGKFSAIGKSLAGESDAEVITKRYEREIHADLLELTRASKGQMVNGFVLAILSIALWYLLGTTQNQQVACELMRLLCLLALLMWTLEHLVIVCLRITAKRTVPAVQRMKTALETKSFMHVLVILCSGILYWIATL